MVSDYGFSDEIRYYSVFLPDLVSRLRKFFEPRKEVKIVILFGSVLRASAIRDVDVAVYMVPRPSHRELLELGTELELALGIPVDLVPLDELPPGMRYKVLTEGLPILIRDKLLFEDLILWSLGEELDLRFHYGNEYSM